MANEVKDVCHKMNPLRKSHKQRGDGKTVGTKIVNEVRPMTL